MLIISREKYYRNNIANFIIFKKIDFIVLPILSFLMYFQLNVLINEIEILYNLKSTKHINCLF